MAKAKAKESKERAAVGRERRLALALAAVMDAYSEIPSPEEHRDAVEEAETSATELLNELGYNGIESIPRRLARLEAELATALESKDYAKVAELGAELEKAKAGRFHKSAPVESE